MDAKEFEILEARAVTIGIGAAEGFGNTNVYVRCQGICNEIRKHEADLEPHEITEIFNNVRKATKSEIGVTQLREVLGHERKRASQLARSMRSQLRSILDQECRPDPDQVVVLKKTWSKLIPRLESKQVPLEETFGFQESSPTV